MEHCPFCGSDDGLFTKTVVRIFVGYTFDGTCEGEVDREYVASYNRRRKRDNDKGQSVYCKNCHKRLGYLEDI